MKVCTEIDKPLVSIVMATYNPRMDWFKEQLISLNNQSYETLELLILDDCSPNVTIEEIAECVGACINSFPYRILQNEQNLGSTKTFEKLTLLAGGEYIAYCDQDDVWHENKIECYLSAFENSDAVLVFSDVNIIDAVGKMITDSITKIRKHHKFQSGKSLGKTLLFKNFVMGCAMMIKADKAREAIPFCPHMVHDHWLALHSAIAGEILFLNLAYVDYRVHETNQTLMLAGVVDKESYVKIRIEEALQKFIWLQQRFREDNGLSQTIVQAIEWMEARRDNFRKTGHSTRTIWKYRRFSCMTSLFEIAAPFMPEKLFGFCIALGRKNIV